MPGLIGITYHYDDQTTLKVPVNDVTIVVTTQAATLDRHWVDGPACPIHGKWKALPAGISKKTGKQYDAFYVCDTKPDEERCQYAPHKSWRELHPAAIAAAEPEPLFEPGPETPSAGADFDDLPF